MKSNLSIAVNNTKNHKDKIRALWERIREKAEKKKLKKDLVANKLNSSYAPV